MPIEVPIIAVIILYVAIGVLCYWAGFNRGWSLCADWVKKVLNETKVEELVDNARTKK